MEEITTLEDTLDSRDVEERIVYLRSKGDEMSGSELEELSALTLLKTEYVDSFGEESWSFGASLIRESYFERYAEELAYDVGAVNSNMNWPNNHIDWAAAAEELSMDYTVVTFDGVDYYTQEA